MSVTVFQHFEVATFEVATFHVHAYILLCFLKVAAIIHLLQDVWEMI